KSAPVSTPLVTSSTSLTDSPPAALGQPGTQVLVGDNLGFGVSSGLRATLGAELRSGLALEASYILLERKPANYGAASDASGSPLLGHPFFNTAAGVEDALLISNFDPATGRFSGTTSVVATSRLQSWELNALTAGCCRGNWKFRPLVGFRALALD